MADLTKKDIQQLLDKQTKELKGYVDKKTEVILHGVAKGFKNEHEYGDACSNRLEASSEGVRQKTVEHDRKFIKIEEALQVKL